MGPKSGNVEKVLVFVCFLEGQKGEGSFGSLNSGWGGRFLGWRGGVISNMFD